MIATERLHHRYGKTVTLAGTFSRKSLSKEQAAHLAEDLTHEVFLRLNRALDRLDPDRDPTGWVFTVATNCVRDHWRSRSHKSKQRDTELKPEHHEVLAAQEIVEAAADTDVGAIERLDALTSETERLRGDILDARDGLERRCQHEDRI